MIYLPVCRGVIIVHPGQITIRRQAFTRTPAALNSTSM